MPLCAVQGDPNSHGGGDLIAANPQTVFINSIPVIDHAPDPANPDSFCPAPGHCNPETAEGSPNVFYYFNPVHRMQDARVCGATTVVELQSNVFANDGPNDGGGTAAFSNADKRIPLPIDPIPQASLTAAAINYTRVIISLAPKFSQLPYNDYPRSIPDTITTTQRNTAVFNTIEDIFDKLNIQPYVPFSNVSNEPFKTDQITPEALSAATLSYTKTILDQAKKQGVYPNSDRLPFEPKTSPDFLEKADELTDSQSLKLVSTYADKIINSPEILEKYPNWPNLPFGGNNGNT